MGAQSLVRRTQARSILSATTGFIAEAGFTHSLTPARNCTYGCAYCYVPTMGIYGGLKPEDWQRWGQFTTFKTNAAELLLRGPHRAKVIYCSPLVDPYQPAEETETAMPAILDALIASPPEVFVIQTRGPLILRDLERIGELARRTILRVSFSVTTDREDVRRLYEPRCASFEERLSVIARLRESGITVYATLAPLLPCDPERLARASIDATGRDLIGDPLHVRAVKRHGATTREVAYRISERQGFLDWFDPAFQAQVVARIASVARVVGHSFATGPEGFSRLARRQSENTDRARASMEP